MNTSTQTNRLHSKEEPNEKRKNGRIDIGPYVFIAPALLLYAAFFLYPALQLILLTFQNWDGIEPKKFAGLSNYSKLLFDDPKFWVAFQHNLFWVVAAVIVPVLFGLFLAILLSRSPMRGKVVFRAIYFLPQVLSSVVVAMLHQDGYPQEIVDHSDHRSVVHGRHQGLFMKVNQPTAAVRKTTEIQTFMRCRPLAGVFPPFVAAGKLHARLQDPAPETLPVKPVQFDKCLGQR